MSEESFWKGRCGAETSTGRRCMHRAIKGYQGRCYLHRPPGAPRKLPEHGSLPERCKTVSPSGWPCERPPMEGKAHCLTHLRDVLRSPSQPRPCRTCERLERACSRHGGEGLSRCEERSAGGEPCGRWATEGTKVCSHHRRRDEQMRALEAECGALRGEIRQLRSALEGARAELDLTRAMRAGAPPVRRVNGEARS